MSAFQPSEPLRQLLLELPGRVATRRIDRMWIFPPREVGRKESGLVVLSLLAADGEPAEQRRVVTLRYEAEGSGRRSRRSEEMTEQGSAPADRVPRLIAGVVRRLRDESEDPLELVFAGDPEQWDAWFGELVGDAVDPPNGE